MMINAGRIGRMYSRFENFNVAEIKQHLTLYVSNGLSPPPGVEQKISSQTEDIFNGEDLCHSLFKGEKGVRRHKEFKIFLAMINPFIPPTCLNKNPYANIDPLLKQAIFVSQRAIFIGRCISIDEQTIGMQGKHKAKL